MGNNLRFVLTAKEALNQLKNLNDDAILVDVAAGDGSGYFPKLTPLGKGDLHAYERDYISDIRNHAFDIQNITAILIDNSDSKKFEREFLPMTNNLKPEIPNYALTIGQVKQILSSVPPITAILKKSDDKYISPAYLGNYNNESFPFVNKDGKPITAGLSNNQTVTFTFAGKSGSIIGALKFDFISK